MIKNLLIIFLFTIGLFAQEKQKPEIQNEDLMHLPLEDLLSVEVSVGTRGSDRTSFNSPTPIDIITAEDISKSGLTELTSVIQRYIPSFNAPRSSVTDGSDHVQAFSLRGLGADQMLVLINGVRKHNTALLHVNSTILRGTTSNDLNVIPVNAIERIEFLRDGAAAQYGSDAISGVINIVLKTHPSNEFYIRYGQTSKNDGITTNLAATTGYTFDKNDFLVVTAELRDRGMTNRSIPLNDADVQGVDQVLKGRQIYRVGDARARDLSMIFNYANQTDNQDLKLFAYGYVNERKGESAGYYRKPSQSRVPQYGFPEGFLPLLTPQISDRNLTFGVETDVIDWKTNISLSYGSNEMQFNLKNSLNSSLGPNSQRDFYCGTLNYNRYLLNINMFKQYDIGLNDLINVGMGSEIRYESFSQFKGEEASYITGSYGDTLNGIIRSSYPGMAQMFPGYTPRDEKQKFRNNYSLYLDIENNIFQNLLAGLAGRYEDYSDFGSSFNGKLALRFEPVTKLAIRTSISTGFRAPSLSQSYFTAIQTNLVNGSLTQSGTYSVDDPVAIELGSKPLKPEKTLHFSAGLTTQLISDFSFSIDFFYVQIKDRIAFTGSFSPATSNYVKSVLTKHNIQAAKYFTNAYNTITGGVDIEGKYNANFNNYGNIVISALLHFNKTKFDGEVRVPDKMNDAKDVFFDRKQITQTEDGQPKDVFQFTLNYSIRQFETLIKLIHYGDIKFVEDPRDPSLDQVFKGKFILDVEFGFRLMKNIEIQLVGHNVLDSYPDPYLPGRGDYFFPYYSEATPYGHNGMDWAVRVKYKF